MATPKTPAQVYKAYKDGSTISDKDLIAGHLHFTVMAQYLLTAGEAFSLAFREANRVAYSLEQYAEARGIAEQLIVPASALPN